VDGVRHAEVQDVHVGVVQDPPHVVRHAPDAELLGEGPRALRPERRHPAEIDVDAPDVAVGLGVDPGDEPRPGQTDTHPGSLLRHHSSKPGSDPDSSYSAEPKFHSIPRIRPSRRRKCTVSG
jgi:hypothetical protein